MWKDSKIQKTRDLNYIYNNELGKVCFAYDAAYGNSKNLAKITIWDKVLKQRGYESALNLQYDGYQRE